MSVLKLDLINELRATIHTHDVFFLSWFLEGLDIESAKNHSPAELEMNVLTICNEMNIMAAPVPHGYFGDADFLINGTFPDYVRACGEGCGFYLSPDCYTPEGEYTKEAEKAISEIKKLFDFCTKSIESTSDEVPADELKKLCELIMEFGLEYEPWRTHAADLYENIDALLENPNDVEVVDKFISDYYTFKRDAVEAIKEI